MSKKLRNITAIILLIVFAIWIVFSVIPKGGEKQPVRKSRPESVEPQFEKEGELAFIDPASADTVKVIDIELAERPEEIQYGMMYRKSMDENTGMLFLMPDERRQSFYMKNTYVPLDIIFINSQSRVVSIQKNAKPLDQTSLPSEGPASMVLEVPGGFTDTHNIGPGTKITWMRK